MSYGVGITTRNRISSLKAAFDHFITFSSGVSKYVIVDDSSSPENECDDLVEWFRSSVDAEVVLRKSTTRLGISKAKNACLYPLQDMDHIFLFDDDSWPQVEGWADRWVKATESNGIHHSMIISDLYRDTGNSFYRVTGTVGDGDTAIDNWSNCLGCVLHFTNHAIRTVGGYDEDNAKNVYGYEHAQMSKRCRDAGLTSGMMYPSPRGAYDWVYCVDIHWVWHNILPPLDIPGREFFSSSVTPEEARQSKLNSPMMSSTTVHIPLRDPLDDCLCQQ